MKSTAEQKEEYGIEMLVDGEWWTPIRIFATVSDAAKQQAVRRIKKHGAGKTRLWGHVGNSWMPIARYIGTSLTLHRF